ncbi:hypothetical protein CWC05_11720 [Pseudoalteromonas ruthenica]|uniref:Phage shock protein B n=1 Tax=Pseudoalteromonas ruthenica TaxID=151081 RepID=A0A5S3Z4B7_9GAMM|nr:hypothetical protein [Pseudoalteromonas ruthenica]TMP86680.1 hypothetical protein CWC05_11720 [Pseudoalteromonas ruthenica]
MYIALMLVVAALVIVATVMVVDIRNKQKALNARAGRENEQLTTMSKELSQLKERVQILEKVVTDKGFSVEQEINNL